MRLTCRPPERTKQKHPEPLPFKMSSTAIPLSPPPAVPPSPSSAAAASLLPPLVLPTPPNTTTPVSSQSSSNPPPTQLHNSAPELQNTNSRAPKPPYSAQPPRPISPTQPRPSQNDILKRIVKADDAIKKRSSSSSSPTTHFKGVKGTIVQPPPLSKYKRPPPIVPNRPGERYPLGIPQTCAREDCAQNSKASVSRHCISEYVQKGARGSCIPKDLRVEWCNTCYMTHRRDADYYPRVFSLLLDQLEICAKEDNATKFCMWYKDEEFLVDLIEAHEFILRIWEKWDRDGKIRKFRIIPEKY